MKATNLRVEQQHPARIDAGVYIKPIWVLRFEFGGINRCVSINCGGNSKPLGKDLEEACEGLGLSLEEIYEIYLRE